jgi:hypothetical protein
MEKAGEKVPVNIVDLNDELASYLNACCKMQVINFPPILVIKLNRVRFNRYFYSVLSNYGKIIFDQCNYNLHSSINLRLNITS